MKSLFYRLKQNQLKYNELQILQMNVKAVWALDVPHDNTANRNDRMILNFIVLISYAL